MKKRIQILRKKKVYVLLLAALAILGIAACGNQNGKEKEGRGKEISENNSGEAGSKETDAEDPEETEIQIFLAASLNQVIEELAKEYQQIRPEVSIACNADSSGTLLTQIEEGYECDIFFSAAQKQMDQLEKDGLVAEGTRSDVVNNQVVVVTRKDSGTAVKGLENLGEAASIALAGGSVPAGRYTRQALMNLGILEKTEDPASITTRQVQEALGGVEISEQENVSKVLLAVVEGSCEVGTVYYSDTYGYEDDLEILQTVSSDLTGNVVYPIAQVINQEADEAQSEAARDFISFILSDTAKEIFEKYYFDTNIL